MDEEKKEEGKIGKERMFENWQEKKEKYIVEILKLATQPLSDEPEAMWRQMKDCECRTGYCHFLLAECNAFLDRAEHGEVVSIDAKYGRKGATEFERKVMVKSAVSEIKEFRDKIEGLISAINQKIMAGLGRMRYIRGLPLEEARRVN